MRKQYSHQQSQRRIAAVAVETALVIPLILLFTLGTLDICDGIFLRTKAKIAAYEGARVMVAPFSTEEEARDAVARYLESRNIRFDDINDVVDIEYQRIVGIDARIDQAIEGNPRPPSIISGNANNTEQLDPVTVSVRIDLAQNRRLPITPFQFIQGDAMVADCTMLLEGELLE